MIGEAVRNGSRAGGDLIVDSGKVIRGRLFLQDQHYPPDNPLIIRADTAGAPAILDGDYEWPHGDFAVTKLPDGTAQHSNEPFQSHYGEFKPKGFVWGGLLHMKNCSNVHIVDLDITQSRGGGLVVEGCTGIKYLGGAITHNRHAAIRVIRSHDVELAPREVHENANFARVSRSAKKMNWPVIVNVTHDSTKVIVRDAWIHGNWGENIGSGKNVDGLTWHRLTVGPGMAMGGYLHLGRNVLVDACLFYHDQSITYNRGSTPAPLLVINREENIATSEGGALSVKDCLFLPRSDSVGISMWRNQGAGKTGPLRIERNVLISQGGPLLASLGNIAPFHKDTLFAENVFARMNRGICYDDGNELKTPIDGPSVSFKGNTWSAAPPASMRGDGDTIGIPDWAKFRLAEGIKPGERPLWSDFVFSPGEPVAPDYTVALAGLLDQMGSALAEARAIVVKMGGTQ